MNDTATRIHAIREAIEQARQRRGGTTPVTLVGVSKRHPASHIKHALAAGLIDFGENYAQELRDKRSELIDLSPAPHWHFIGPLQSNKINMVLGATLIHTIDRPALLEGLEQRCRRNETDQAVLVQVNLAHEASKSGVSPDELPALLDRFVDCDRVRCHGLMLIPPAGPPEATRRHFQGLARLRDQLAGQSRPGIDLRELSMGMSSDFEVAIEEGATIVRVGTAIFGPRPTRVDP